MTILGISEEHDSGVAIISDGKVVFAANEERYSGQKLQVGFPILALKSAVDYIKGQSLPLPTHVAIASKFHVDKDLWNWFQPIPPYAIIESLLSKTHLDRLLWGSFFTPNLINLISLFQNPTRRIQIHQKLKACGINSPKLHFIEHHRSHATAAYLNSGWTDCLTVTLDGSGDGYCSQVYSCTNNKMTLKQSVPFFHSPGHYYIHTTEILGFKPGREGKVTGLSARGNPKYTYPIFAKELSYSIQKHSFINHGKYRRAETEKLQNLLAKFPKEDIAAGAQAHLEKVVVDFVRDMINLFSKNKRTKLTLSGGVFANVRLNQKIAQLPQIESLFVFPHMGDGGLAVGAAMDLYSKLDSIPHPMNNLYLGPGSDSPNQNLSLSKKTAAILAKNKIVAVCRNRMEYGPRALGNRSILAPATSHKMANKLNQILSRSDFMPFAPVIQDIDLPNYFSGWKKVKKCLPFMTTAINCLPQTKKKFPAITHIDDSARPQVVTQISNPFIFDVLTHYKKLTGNPILINTSFNIHEQPIVLSQKEAINIFSKSRLDALIIDDRIIKKRVN